MEWLICLPHQHVRMKPCLFLLPIPMLLMHSVMEATQTDHSLAHIRSLADNKSCMYGWRDGIIGHSFVDTNDVEGSRVVVPFSFKHQVLVLAHDKVGHMGVSKTRELINHYFSWPGVYKDIVRRVSNCASCQEVNKYSPGKAPYQQAPPFCVPRERLAVDLVGPLARSRHGYKYLLTSVCVAIRYPFTVPLKDVAAESVCEALLEIWSQIGIPREVLSDQGTQFMGKVMSQLCKSLHIHQVRASLHSSRTEY